MPRTARTLAGAAAIGMLAILAPAAHAASSAIASPATVATKATCPDYLFMSDTPGSTQYNDYCGPGDVVQVECNTVFDGNDWDQLVLDEDVLRGWVEQSKLDVKHPERIPAC